MTASAASDVTRKSAFWAGIRATIPLVVSAVPFGLIFGTLSVASGVSPLGTMGLSLFVFAGSAQFIGVNLVATGTPVPIIILTTLVVNLRHMLYGATLAPYVRSLPQRWLVPLGFLLSDETFVFVVQRYEQGLPHAHWYHLGVAVADYLSWTLATLGGIVFGSRLEDPGRFGLDFALVLSFIGMLLPLIKNKSLLVAAAVSGLVSVVANPLPYKFSLIIAAIAGVAAGLAARSLLKEPLPETANVPSIENEGMP